MNRLLWLTLLMKRVSFAAENASQNKAISREISSLYGCVEKVSADGENEALGYAGVPGKALVACLSPPPTRGTIALKILQTAVTTAKECFRHLPIPEN
ncbi:hypothetical protein QN219_09455 [Sinorhizobium sp. 7-81]|uniref:hypothetical protein n=1 Tax=Sinorhizobium sp. 8-89 TaxID=3049089 RepID=UPI0024C3A7C4|nr:hypothetical protein [Sinorhizobium sp. 8-89]MDK1490286.1 hypothetical protein [Sinorhizobium sp. 8-89]